MTWVADKSVKGLYQRVRATKTSWAVKARIRGGKTVTVTIGDVTKISPAQARQEAKSIIAKTATGINPSAEKKVAQEVARARGLTFGQAIAEYTQLTPWADKTRKDSLETLKRRFGDWYSRPLASITRDDCLKRFRQIKSDVAKRQVAIDKRMEAKGRIRLTPMNEYGVAEAQKAFRIVNAIFRFRGNDSVGSEKLLPQGNPVEVLKDKRQRHVLKRRENFLDTEQRERLLAELSLVGHPQNNTGVTQDDADLVWLLLHTGCRFTEIRNMRWENIDWKKETLTAVDTKNHTNHTLPITGRIKTVLERRHLAKRGDFVFPSPMDSEKAMTARATFERLSKAIDFKFTAHDLRRTLATVASEQGVDLDAVGRVLNHKRQGVTAGYIQTTQKRLKDTLEMVASAFFEEPVLGDVGVEEVPYSAL